jgi:acetyl-CoA synthetase
LKRDTLAELPPEDAVWRWAVRWLDQNPAQGLNTYRECCGRWASNPSRLSLIICHPSGQSEQWTYSELGRASARASRMFARLGLRRGDRVAAVLSRQVEAWICALGAWRSGLVYVPLFSGFGADALATRLRISQARTVVVNQRSKGLLDEALGLLKADLPVVTVTSRNEGLRRGERDFWHELESSAPDAPDVHTKATETATLMFTSGTASEPKACLLPHAALVGLLPFVRHSMAIDSQDLLFATSDPSWGYGLYTTGCAVMALGITRLLYSGDFDSSEWVRLMARERVTYVAGAPTAFRRLVTNTLPSIPSLRGASTAGEALDAETVVRWSEATGTPLRDGYGLTEVGMVLANLGYPDLPIVPGSLAAAVPGFDVRLVDADGEPVTDGDDGLIAVRRMPYFTSTGYENAPETWAAHWKGDLFVTDDLARRDSAGGWRFVGRADDVIVTAGYNVGPLEVESALRAHPAVVDAAVVAVPDPKRGAIVRAVIVRTPGGLDNDSLSRELQDVVKRRVGRHAYPRVIDYVDSLPRTETGKVQRSLLRVVTA